MGMDAPFSPRQTAAASSQQLPLKASSSPPNTSMDHRAMLKMDGASPDRMLIAFDSDSQSCCPSVGDITWDQSEAMAFHQSSLEQRQLHSQQQHPWQNFTEIHPSSSAAVSKNRSLPSLPIESRSLPRKSKNQLTAFVKSQTTPNLQKHQKPNKFPTERHSPSSSPPGSDKRGHTASAVITSPPKKSISKSPIRKQVQQNKIEVSVNFGGSPSQKPPDEVNLAVLFSRKKELSRKENVPKLPLANVDSPKPSRQPSRSLFDASNLYSPPPPQEQFWPGVPTKVAPTTRKPPNVQPSSQDIHESTGEQKVLPATTKTSNQRTLQPDHIRSPCDSMQKDVPKAAVVKQAGTAAVEMNRLHFDEKGGLHSKSWKKLNSSKSSLHSTSKHIEESIQSLETTLFGFSNKNTASHLCDMDEGENNHAMESEKEMDDADENDDYDVVNEIVDDYIDFDTAMAMTSAIMEG